MENLLYEYGPSIAYVLLLLGSFIEGESVVLTAGFLSYTKFLSFPVVVMISFFGSLISDQLLFHIGRVYTPSIFNKTEKWKKRSERAFNLLNRYHTGFILGFRFIYGIRIISPLLIGASGVSVKRFSVLNFIAAFIWAIVSSSIGWILGYFFSDKIELAFKLVKNSQKILALTTISVLGLMSLIFFLRKRRKQKLLKLETGL